MRTPVTSGTRSGLTLVEAAITATLLIVVLLNLSRVTQSAFTQARQGTALMTAESQGARTMARIVEAVRWADSDTIIPVARPPFTTRALEFQTVEDFRDGATVWSNLQRIELELGRGRVTWTEAPGQPGEKIVGLCSGVPDLLEQELANGLDDNGNALVDEPGLCFTSEGEVLVIRLTVSVPVSTGAPMFRSYETRISPRN